MNLNHPFNLDISNLEDLNLDLEQQLTEEEAARVGGGLTFTTLALGEEGGDYSKFPQPQPGPIDPPEYTTQALGEEGGDYPEFPQPQPDPIDPPEYTTQALGEEGGYLIELG